MNYKSAVGQKIIRREDGVAGIIEKIDEKGIIFIRYEGNDFAGGYMFDPFIEGRVYFADPEFQKPIDEELAKIQREQDEMMAKIQTKDASEENYYITKANENDEDEKVFSLCCTEEEAYAAFYYACHEQKKEMWASGKGFRWLTLKLFETKTGNQLAQES